MENGLPPEALALEMYMSGEMESVWRNFRQNGFAASARSHGPTAMYGGLLRTVEPALGGLEDQFRRTWAEIRDGRFAAQFQEERAGGYPLLRQAASMHGELGPLTNAEERLRNLLADAFIPAPRRA